MTRLRVPPIQTSSWVRDVATAINQLLGDIPEDGATGQVLAKKTADDFDMEWKTVAEASHTHPIADVTNLQSSLDAKAPIADPAFTGAVGLPPYTVATLPSASPAGRIIYVTNDASGATPAYSNGTNWLRFDSHAVIS